jgi:tetratricopeptide (TPR) repeat protein
VDKGDYNKAVDDFTESIRLDPKDAKAFYHRGMAYWRKLEYDKTIADQTEAIRLDPKDPMAYYSRGMAYFVTDKKDKAELDFKKSRKLGFLPK